MLVRYVVGQFQLVEGDDLKLKLKLKFQLVEGDLEFRKITKIHRVFEGLNSCQFESDKMFYVRSCLLQKV